jgi:hypothetical protein
MVGVMVRARDKGRSDEVIVRVRTSAGHVPLVRVACRDPMIA